MSISTQLLMAEITGVSRCTCVRPARQTRAAPTSPAHTAGICAIDAAGARPLGTAPTTTKIATCVGGDTACRCFLSLAGECTYRSRGSAATCVSGGSACRSPGQAGVGPAASTRAKQDGCKHGQLNKVLPPGGSACRWPGQAGVGPAAWNNST
eukprot:scaffold117139_cov23-Tisochrysis_lutea.AAC.1